MFSKETRRKLTWRIHFENHFHVIAIFPPCSFETIIHRIESSFEIKWPFLIFDGKGVPAHLSDCMKSGSYSLQPKIDNKPSILHSKKTTSVSTGNRDLGPLPSVQQLLEEWPPFLITSHVIWRSRQNVNLNYYDTHVGEGTSGQFFVVALSSDKEKQVIGLKILSKTVLASMVTERDLVAEMYKVEVEQLKHDILEENEMRYGPPLPESVAKNMAIDKIKKDHSSVGNLGEWRHLNNPNEQKVAYRLERESIEKEKEDRKLALQKSIVHLAQQRIDIGESKKLKFLTFEGDPSNIEIRLESSENATLITTAELENEIPSEHFEILLKRHRDAISQIHCSMAEGDAVRHAAMKTLEQTNIKIARRMIWMHQMDLEEKARAERLRAERENAASCIQEMWKKKTQGKKRKKVRKKKMVK